MCVKLSSRYLNSNIYPLHSTSTYTCGVTIAHLKGINVKFTHLIPKITHISQWKI